MYAFDMTIVSFNKSAGEAFASTPASSSSPVIGHQKPDHIPQFQRWSVVFWTRVTSSHSEDHWQGGAGSSDLGREATSPCRTREAVIIMHGKGKPIRRDAL
jgi:hypothetical protein